MRKKIGENEEIELKNEYKTPSGIKFYTKDKLNGIKSTGDKEKDNKSSKKPGSRPMSSFGGDDNE